MRIADGHGYAVTHLEGGGIEIAGTEEDGHHVVDAVLVSARLPEVFSMRRDAVFLQLAVAVGITVPYLINIIATAFTGTLSEIKRREVGVTIAE